MLHFRRIAILLLAMTAGCVSRTPVNPSFPASVDQGEKILSADTAHPKPLSRPLVIVGGFFDPGFAQLLLAHDFRQYTHDDRVIGVTLGLSFDPDDYRQRIITAVDKAFPSNDPVMTTEVDVIGYSMGGLAARYAAINPAPGRRLRIARLFTIASPHTGARSAMITSFNLFKLQEQMRPGSVFLRNLNHTAALFPVYAYVCLNDRVVGAAYAAPPGQTPWWVSPPIFFSSHDWAFMDPRIRADILTRLRDEPPLSHDPPKAIPPDSFAKTSPR
jgi:pimeloyl-ACP methyl ester carboxylesterase